MCARACVCMGVRARVYRCARACVWECARVCVPMCVCLCLRGCVRVFAIQQTSSVDLCVHEMYSCIHVNVFQFVVS